MDSGRVLTLSYSSVFDDPRVMMEGRILSSLGYNVSVLGVGLGTRPGRTTVDGMSVAIVPLVSDHRPLAVVRAARALLRGDLTSASSDARRSTYLSLLFFNLWVLRLGRADPIRAIHCHEHQPLPSAWLLSRLLGAKLVYDSHENTSLNRAGIGPKGALTIRLERLLLPRVDAVITVGERLKRSLLARGARRVIVIGNWKRRSDFNIDPTDLTRLRLELGLPSGGLIVSYIGLLDPTRDIEPLIDAVGEMPDVHLLIAGRGLLAERVEEMAGTHGNIHWLGWLPLDEVPTYTQLSDVIFCSISPTLRQFEFQMPNKLFDAFAARKAVIARAGNGEMNDLLKRYRAGVQLVEVTADSIQAALRRLQDPEILRALQIQAEAGGLEYNTDTARARLQELFQELAGGPTTPR